MDIVIYTEGLPFDGATPFERSLGGSESAVVFMARELARRGHKVRVFCHCPRPGEYDGATYQDAADYRAFVAADECDVFICCRHLRGLTAPLRSQVYLLWCHDVMTAPAAEQVSSLMYRVDRLLTLSEFHRAQCQRHLALPDDSYVVTRNGVDLSLVEEATAGVGRDQNRLLYTSRPERGLDVLLSLWPELKARRPALTLGIVHYENPPADAQMAEYVGTLRRIAGQLPEVEFLPPLNKRELYRELAGAGLVVYPSTFPEVSCISMIEAAACGTPVVASRYCALQETVAGGETGLLLPGDPHTEGYQQAFIEAVAGLAGDDSRWEMMSAAARARVEARYQWRDIAGEWEEMFEELTHVAGASPCRTKSITVGQELASCPVEDGVGGTVGGHRYARPTAHKQTLSVCMIVKNAQGTLYRCLDSVKPFADEIIVCDTGSSDRTREIAREYTGQVFELPWPDDFAAARNHSIERATGDWILWLDADEWLLGGEHLGKYLRSNMYLGYVIKQHHCSIDAEFKPDVPVRLFRNRRGIRFYGCVHEHPETALNEGVQPSVILSDVHIMHDGYATEAIRRQRFLRNLPLVLKDRRENPARRLGLIFLARDYLHLARYEMEHTQGQLTDRAAKYLRRARAVHREHFQSPDDPLHGYSFPLYQSALRLLGEGFELECALAIEGGGEPPHHRIRVADEDEAKAFLDRQLEELLRETRGEDEFPFNVAAGLGICVTERLGV